MSSDGVNGGTATEGSDSKLKRFGRGGARRFREMDLKKGMAALPPYAGLVAMVIYFSVRSPVFLTSTNFGNIVRYASILLVVALAETFVILVGSIDLSIGAMVTLTGLSTAFLTREGLNEPTVVVAVLLIGVLAGTTNGLIYTVGRIPSFLATLGTSFIFVGAALKLYGAVPIPLDAPGLSDLLSGISLGVPNAGVVAFVLLLIAILVARRTTVGRYMYAIGGNERAAELTGLRVVLVKRIAFALSGLLCAVAGILLAVRIGSGTSEMGAELLLPAIAAVIVGGTSLVGGIGGPQRTILGVMLLSVLVNGMTLISVDPFTQLVVQGVVVIAAVVIGGFGVPKAIEK